MLKAQKLKELDTYGDIGMAAKDFARDGMFVSLPNMLKPTLPM